MANKSRVFSYKRAVWDGDVGVTLQGILKECHLLKNKMSEREFEYGELLLRGVKAELLDNGFFIRITVFESGEKAASVAGKGRANAIVNPDILTHEAPAGREFVKGELYLYIVDDHVLLATAFSKDVYAGVYIYDMISSCGYEELADKLDISYVGDKKNVAYIAKHGISSINFKVSLYEASLQRIKKANKKGVWFKKLFSSFVDERYLKEDVDRFNISANMVFSFNDSAAKKGADDKVGDLGQKKLKELASEVIREAEFDGGYTIKTGNGLVLKPHQMRVSKTYSVNTIAGFITEDAAKEKLRSFYLYLESKGILAE